MITEHSKTKYFAKRKLIRAAIEHFLVKPKAQSVRVISHWNDEPIPDCVDSGKFDILVKKGRLIRLTFNFMVQRNWYKLLDNEFWTKKRVEDVFDKLENDDH